MATPLEPTDESQFYQFLLKQSPTDIPLVPDCVVIKPSGLATTFLPGQANGLFATRTIGRSRGLYPDSNDRLAGAPNDPCVDLTAFIASTNNVERYKALCDLYDNYYDANKLALVNCVATMTPQGMIYTALKRIEAGEEIYRCYGRVTWVTELIKLADTRNIPAFAHWLHHIVKTTAPSTTNYQMLVDMEKAVDPSRELSLEAADRKLLETKPPVRLLLPEINREMKMYATLRLMGIKNIRPAPGN